MAPWQPATTPWRKPAADVLKKTQSGTPSQSHILAVLHCSIEDYNSIVPFISERLRKEGIGSADSLASTEKRHMTKVIAKDLMNHPEHREMLQWACGQGETEENIIAALCGAVRNVHAASKRRGKRIKSEGMETSVSASIATPDSQDQSAQSLRTKPSETILNTRVSPALPPPVTTGVYLVRLTIPDETLSDLGLKYIIAIPRALTEDERYQRIQDEAQKRLSDQTRQFVLAEPQPDRRKCICDDAATFSVLLDQHHQASTKLNLDVMFTRETRNVTRSRSRPILPSIETDLSTATSPPQTSRNEQRPVVSSHRAKRPAPKDTDSETEETPILKRPRTNHAGAHNPKTKIVILKVSRPTAQSQSEQETPEDNTSTYHEDNPSNIEILLDTSPEGQACNSMKIELKMFLSLDTS